MTQSPSSPGAPARRTFRAPRRPARPPMGTLRAGAAKTAPATDGAPENRAEHLSAVFLRRSGNGRPPERFPRSRSHGDRRETSPWTKNGRTPQIGQRHGTYDKRRWSTHTNDLRHPFPKRPGSGFTARTPAMRPPGTLPPEASAESPCASSPAAVFRICRASDYGIAFRCVTNRRAFIFSASERRSGSCP